MADQKSKTKLKCDYSASSYFNNQQQAPSSSRSADSLMKRPKPKETDDDLMKLQKDFLASKCRPAARVVKNTGKMNFPENSTSFSVKEEEKEDENEFRMPTTEQKLKQIDVSSSLTTMKNGPKMPPKDLVKMDPFQNEGPLSFSSSTKSIHIPPTKKLKAEQKTRVAGVSSDLDQESFATVLTSIIERDTKNANVCAPRVSKDGFPQVVHRGALNANNSSLKLADKTKKKKSLFAQQFHKSSNVGSSPSSIPSASNIDSQGLGVALSSNIITGMGLSASQAKSEAQAIHQENLSKISQMGQEEILSEQNQLLSTLDKNIVNFLRNKKSRKPDADTSIQEMETEPTADTNLKRNVKNPETEISKDEIPVKPDENLVHMETLELEKLAWMKDLPKPKVDASKGATARFDFEGRLVPAEANIPVNQGLHHHGEDAERAGYTLEELFHLCRSLNSQQRTLALKTIGHVIANVKTGMFEESVQSPILPAVLNAGLVFLLRWSLDDKIDNVLVASVFALHALLTNAADEDSLEFTFCWYRGREAPAHSTANEQQKVPEEKLDFLEKVEETDADKVKEDVVRALVRSMSLLQRLRYLLEMWNPPLQTVNCILEILVRIARNSKQDAYSVCQCPRLLEFVVNRFLPMSWSAKSALQDNMNEYSVISAMRLIKAIAQAGKSMAADLIARFQIPKRIFSYIAQKPREMKLSVTAAYKLQITSLQTWQVFLAYGLAGEGYLELYPLLMSNLQSIVSMPKEYKTLTLCWESAILGVLEAAMQLAGSHSRIHGKFNSSLKQQQSACVSSSTQLPAPPIKWSQVVGLLEPVLVLLQRNLKDITDNFHFDKHCLNVATSAVNFVASFYKIWSFQPDYDALKTLPQLEKLCEFFLTSLWPSAGFRSIMVRLLSHSLILNGDKYIRKDSAPNLQDFRCRASAGTAETLPILRTDTPFGFLIGLLRFYNVICTLHKGLSSILASLVTTDEDVRAYVKAVTQSFSMTPNSCPFLKFENQLQYYVLKLVSKSGSSYASVPMFHQLALALTTRLHYGDEHLAHTLLSTIIFNKEFLTSDFQLEAPIKEFSLLKITKSNEESSSLFWNSLSQQAVSLLNSVRASYMIAFSQRELAMLRSKSRCLAHYEEIDSFVTEKLGEALLPCDWMFLPIIEMYSIVNSPQEDGKCIEKLSEMQTLQIANALRWIFLLEFKKSRAMSIIPVTHKLSRLMCVFLTGNELFMDPVVHTHLAALLHLYSSGASLEQMDFEKPIPGLLSFYDFFMSFLQQYESVSFGDPVFGSYVLLPLQQRHNALMRKAIWSEHTAVLRTLRVSIKDHLVPIENYLYPEETNTEILRLILLALLMGAVNPQWAPVMYLVAVHHLNRFLFHQTDQDNSLKKFMFGQISRCPSQQIKNHVLFYKQHNIEKEFGMEFYSELPSIRQSLLQRMIGKKLT